MRHVGACDAAPPAPLIEPAALSRCDQREEGRSTMYLYLRRSIAGLAGSVFSCFDTNKWRLCSSCRAPRCKPCRCLCLFPYVSVLARLFSPASFSLQYFPLPAPPRPPCTYIHITSVSVFFLFLFVACQWSSFRKQVEEGQTVLVMNEPDLSEDMDGWTEWYKHITEAVERLTLELDERF